MSAPPIDRLSAAPSADTKSPSSGAGKKAAAAAGNAAEKKPFFKSKKFLIVLVLLLAGAGGGYKMMVKPKAGPPQPGDVVSLDANTLNLADGHYLKIAISVQLVKGKASATDFYTSKAAQAEIDVFSDRDVDVLNSPPGRRRLTAELAKRVKAAYPEEVYDVFVTQFVTQ
jgi:flagellar FliL protein